MYVKETEINPSENQFPVFKPPLRVSFRLAWIKPHIQNGTANFWNSESDAALILSSRLH